MEDILKMAASINEKQRKIDEHTVRELTRALNAIKDDRLVAAQRAIEGLIEIYSVSIATDYQTLKSNTTDGTDHI